jgi:hypothetical protein
MRQQEELEEEKGGKTLFHKLRTGRLNDLGGTGPADLLEETVRKN